MQVAIDVELEHRARRISGSAGRGRPSSGKAELGQIRLIDESIDHANRVVGGNIVFLRQRGENLDFNLNIRQG